MTSVCGMPYLAIASVSQESVWGDAATTAGRALAASRRERARRVMRVESRTHRLSVVGCERAADLDERADVNSWTPRTLGGLTVLMDLSPKVSTKPAVKRI